MQMRHGDVWIEACDVIPEGAIKVMPEARGYVLAEGEVTGHAHTIEATPDVEMFEKDGTLYLRVSGDGVGLRHQEHAERVIPRGVHRVTPQYGYNAGMVQRTTD